MPEAIQKVALVTGAGRGIGQATAIRLAEDGIDVAVHDIDPVTAEATAEIILAMGRRACAFDADVADRRRMAQVVNEAEREFGRIDILVNNAGVSSDRCPIEKVTHEMFMHSINIHVGGTLFTTQSVVPGMKRRRYGKIVNISSIQALVGWSEGATYNAAKGAVIGLARGWAKEFAPWNIAVNVVAPGHTETEMVIRNDPPELRAEKAKTIPLGRYGTPREMADAIAFLASDQASFITGQVISPNGGFVIA